MAWFGKVCYLLKGVTHKELKPCFFQNGLDDDAIFTYSPQELEHEITNNNLFFYVVVEPDDCIFVSSDFGSFSCDYKDRIEAIWKIRGRKENFETISNWCNLQKRKYEDKDTMLYIFCEAGISEELLREIISEQVDEDERITFPPSNMLLIRDINKNIMDEKAKEMCSNNPFCGGKYIKIYVDGNITMVDVFDGKQYILEKEDVDIISILNFNFNMSAEECYMDLEPEKKRIADYWASSSEEEDDF